MTPPGPMPADLAAAFVALDVPSIAGKAGKSDWRLITTASLSGNYVIPSYTVFGPDGKNYGSQAGAPVSAADWSNGDKDALNKAANADALALCKLLAKANATVQQSNPQSLENRPARIFMGKVTGAPTDGDSALAQDIARNLPGIDTVLVTDPAAADFVVDGAVKTQPDSDNQILVQLVWTVRDSNHRVIGDVTQLHDLKLADITPYWGDVAAAAAAEGASGVQQVITNNTLKENRRRRYAGAATGESVSTTVRAGLPYEANSSAPPCRNAPSSSLDAPAVLLWRTATRRISHAGLHNLR